ncbi:4-(cytidine 5'-diphospho)-2-C-methyl-D-erythritol kinase [Peptostreptococcus equinus]|uniref:4-diphosphocytidyl-2-C-methyl-D-erythritol kinase n=1 Tax=Peptostreptococcus equinus TaxID=3003601 RepID=A0ABY7JSP2_9FIRM|nr:4-(cytidine 5'-diphospho)-2-C-methyl-D-erythritol kinase [Peptostreptococcus sp. CBA3647]WAW15000.1 4-(cytidine 5'-diphospho)-2-C-methyl-D-erythritol kinase [Peptostreptococcus sp. CBA3647]
MKSVRLKAKGKINLSIDIKGILEDGYHDVEMIMQSVDINDNIVIRKTSKDFRLVCSNPIIPVDDRNIMYKTWYLMKEKFDLKENIEIFLEKNIPIAAGMAGGSADSAAVFVGVNYLFNLGLSEDELMKLSELLGSDIAFCIQGGTSIAVGKGTSLEKISPLNEKIKIIVCKPDIFVSTKKVYNKFDEMNCQGYVFNRPNNKKIIKAIEINDIETLSYEMKNVLEEVTNKWTHQIDDIQEIMKSYNAQLTMMSGSGPTVFGFFNDERDLKKCSRELRKKYTQTYITKPTTKGVEICGNK